MGPQQTNKCEDISEGQQAMFSLVLDPLVQWVSPDMSCNVQLSPDLSSYVQIYPDMFSNVRPCPDRSSHIQFQELFPSLQTPAPLIKSRYKSNTEQKYWELSNPISPLLKTHWIVDTTRKNHCFIFRVNPEALLNKQTNKQKLMFRALLKEKYWKSVHNRCARLIYTLW